MNEGDFLFILGYPGRTYRHQTSYWVTEKVGKATFLPAEMGVK